MFFRTGRIDEQLKNTNIALIPKKKNPALMTDLRPISLYNVVYKIISKVLANHVKQIILDSQRAFIPRGLIMDNIMIAFEVMHFMEKENKRE